jgi:hypothetical protein
LGFCISFSSEEEKMDRGSVRKSVAIGSACALVVLGMARPTRAVNLLQNPSFEAPTDNSGASDDYTVGGWTLMDDTERAKFDKPPDGLWAVWFKTFELDGIWGTDALADGTVPGGGGIWQTVGVQAGGTYSLSSQDFFEAGAPASGATISFGMIWLNSSNAAISKQQLNITPAVETSLGTGAWDPVTTAAIAPAGATSAQIFFTWSGGSVVSGQSQSVLIDTADFDGPGTAPTNSAWAVNGSGDWNSGGNWINGTVPNVAGGEADFFSVITANHNVYTDIADIVGTMNFNNTKTYVIDGAGSLTLQGAGTAGATVIVQAGTQEINLPLTIASNTVFNISSGAALVIGNPLTVNSGKSLTQSGSGTVTYNSLITLQTGATMSFGNSTYAHALTLQGTGAATLASHTGSTQMVLQLDSLTGSGTSMLDLTNNALVVHGGSLSAITTELKTGFNAGSGYWNGAGGIVSSAAASDTKHLTTLGSRQSAGGTFDGVTTTTADVLVKYTYYGDATLDGSVNGADYQQIDLGFGSHLTGWQNGDFNYDGVVDGSDFSLIDNTFNQINAGSTSPLAITAGSADLIASPANTVPEPATLSLLGIGAIGLLGRRSRKVV